jgi:hypothetical protein
MAEFPAVGTPAWADMYLGALSKQDDAMMEQLMQSIDDAWEMQNTRKREELGYEIDTKPKKKPKTRSKRLSMWNVFYSDLRRGPSKGGDDEDWYPDSWNVGDLYHSLSDDARVGLERRTQYLNKRLSDLAD